MKYKVQVWSLVIAIVAVVLFLTWQAVQADKLLSFFGAIWLWQWLLMGISAALTRYGKKLQKEAALNTAVLRALEAKEKRGTPLEDYLSDFEGRL